MLNPPRPYSETITKFVSNVLPFAALALVYVATQVRAAGSRRVTLIRVAKQPSHTWPSNV